MSLRSSARDWVISALLIALTAYSAWQGNQAVAITGAILTVAVTHKAVSRRLLEMGFDLMNRATSVKVSELELKIDRASEMLEAGLDRIQRQSRIEHAITGLTALQS